MHERTKEQKDWQRRGLCMVLALVLALALLPIALPMQRAEARELGGEATLTIVFGQDSSGTPDAKINVSYQFCQDATVEDLLDAAVASGDMENYVLDSGGFMSSCTQDGTTLTNAVSMSTYWAFYVDSAYYAGSDDLTTIKLVDGSSYQFAWDSYLRTVIPDWASIAAPDDSTDEVAGGGTAAGTASLVVSMGFESYGGFLSEDPSQYITANNTYSFSEGATVVDLLDAGVDDSSGYVMFFEDYRLNAGGFLESIDDMIFGTYKNAADFSTHWAFYVNGVYYNGHENLSTLLLEDGAVYQFAWSSYPSAVPPDATTLSQISAAATSGTGIAGISRPIEASPVNEAEVNTLLSNIADALVGTSDPWEAMSLGALGREMPASVNQQALLEDALSAFTTPNTTNVQRAILALSAIGLDATEVPYPASAASSGSFNLVEKLLASTLSTTTVNGQIFAILALESGPYTVPAGTVEALVDDLLANQLADGGFAWDPTSGAPVDPDMTAMAITALATQIENPSTTLGLSVYADDATIIAALQRALTALHIYQLDDGSWGAYDSLANDIVSNIYSTSMAVIALCSVGINPATEWVRDGGATPLSALLSFANASGTSFSGSQMAVEQGFRALVAYQGFVQTNGAFNVYTQTLLGANSQTPAITTPLASGLPATGDGSAALLGVAGVLFVLVSALSLVRRTRNTSVQRQS